MNLAKRNKAALLSLGLSVLLGMAQAQTAQTQMPQEQPPTLPATSAPAVQPAAPQTAAPNKQSHGHAAPTASAVPLRLHAAPGTALEYATTAQVQISAFSLKVVARPGAVLSAADTARLAELNKALSAQTPALKQLLGRALPAATGKQFLKVLPTDTRGNTVLLSTWLAAPLSLGSAAPGASAVPPPGVQGVRLTQVVAPDGTTLNFQVQADDPATQRFLDALTPAERLSSLGQNAQASLYGLNLAPGETRSLTQHLDLSGLLGDLAAALGGAEVTPQIKAQIAMQPLILDVATTFLGRSEAGVLSYQQRFAARPWSLDVQSLGADGQPGTLTLTLSDWSGQGGLSYRPDGLPQTGDSAQSAGLDLSLDVPGVPAQLRAHLEFTLTASSAAR